MTEANNLHLLDTPRDEVAAHKWALNDVSPIRLEGIQQTFEKNGSSMSSNDLLVSLLECTDRLIGKDITFTSVHIQMLLMSAEKGFTPAQAVINRVIQS